MVNLALAFRRISYLFFFLFLSHFLSYSSLFLRKGERVHHGRNNSRRGLILGRTIVVYGTASLTAVKGTCQEYVWALTTAATGLFSLRHWLWGGESAHYSSIGHSDDGARGCKSFAPKVEPCPRSEASSPHVVRRVTLMMTARGRLQHGGKRWSGCGCGGGCGTGTQGSRVVVWTSGATTAVQWHRECARRLGCSNRLRKHINRELRQGVVGSNADRTRC